MKVIERESRVLMHFDMRLKDGSIAESTRTSEKPFEFTLGEGVFSEKLEQQLIGLERGARPKIMLLPVDAFGEPHPANIYEVPLEKFSHMQEKEELKPGLIILFTQPSGQEIPGIIRAVGEYEVTIDFNHPLSGQVILFDIEIIDFN